MLGNSSYVDHFDEQLFDDQHFDELHFDELHFDVNLEMAKAREDVEEISEDRRWPRQVWTTARSILITEWYTTSKF